MAQAAFPCAIGTENHRQGSQLDRPSILPGFEVLDMQMSSISTILLFLIYPMPLAPAAGCGISHIFSQFLVFQHVEGFAGVILAMMLAGSRM